MILLNNNDDFELFGTAMFVTSTCFLGSSRPGNEGQIVFMRQVASRHIFQMPF